MQSIKGYRSMSLLGHGVALGLPRDATRDAIQPTIVVRVGAVA